MKEFNWILDMTDMFNTKSKEEIKVEEVKEPKKIKIKKPDFKAKKEAEKSVKKIKIKKPNFKAIKERKLKQEIKKNEIRTYADIVSKLYMSNWFKFNVYDGEKYFHVSETKIKLRTAIATHLGYNNKRIIKNLNVFATVQYSKFFTFDVDVDDLEIVKSILGELNSLGFNENNYIVSNSKSKGYHIDVYVKKSSDRYYNCSQLFKIYKKVMQNLNLSSHQVEFKPTEKVSISLPLGTKNLNKEDSLITILDNDFNSVKTIKDSLEILNTKEPKILEFLPKVENNTDNLPDCFNENFKEVTFTKVVTKKETYYDVEAVQAVLDEGKLLHKHTRHNMTLGILQHLRHAEDRLEVVKDILTDSVDMYELTLEEALKEAERINDTVGDSNWIGYEVKPVEINLGFVSKLKELYLEDDNLAELLFVIYKLCVLYNSDTVELSRRFYQTLVKKNINGTKKLKLQQDLVDYGFISYNEDELKFVDTENLRKNITKITLNVDYILALNSSDTLVNVTTFSDVVKLFNFNVQCKSNLPSFNEDYNTLYDIISTLVEENKSTTVIINTKILSYFNFNIRNRKLQTMLKKLDSKKVLSYDGTSVIISTLK